MDQGMDEYGFTAGEADARRRLDRFLTEQFRETFSRSRIQSLVKQGWVTVNGKPAKAGCQVVSGDQVLCRVPRTASGPAEAEALPLSVVYEDGDLIVINKARGMVVHPAPGSGSGTLVNALLFHCGDLSGINGVLRPGIVHRIDKDTTGLLVAAKNDWTHHGLTQQLKTRQLTREYIALLHGTIPEGEGLVNAPIGRDPKNRQRMAVIPSGKAAITRYRVLGRADSYTLAHCLLETGRTHQIRVHMAYIRYPVVGDPKYGPKKNAFNLDAQLLHAWRLRFIHPRTGGQLVFSAPLPEDMRAILDTIGMEWKGET
jgi:23S rRNA pseudouridine1911/1915/1917 synthase